MTFSYLFSLSLALSLSFYDGVRAAHIRETWPFLRVWQVRYNVFHDQLVLTAGSDARVVLTSAASLSSEPFGKLVSDDKDNDEGEKANKL